MKIVYIFFLSLILGCLLYMPDAHAQSFHEFFVKVDPATGRYHIIDSLPGVRFVRDFLTCTAIDRDGGRYFFEGQDSAGTDRFYTIDVHSGAILHSPAVIQPCANGNYGQFVFDDSTRTLYGIYQNTCNQTAYFVSIDETTGVFTLIDTLPGARYIAVNIFAYDQMHHHYFFYGATNPGDNLYTIDALTGQVVYSPPPPLGLNQMQYDNTANTLYGVCNASFFVKIDPVTGDTTIIGRVPTLNSVIVAPSDGTFDDVHQRFFIGGSDISGVDYLYSIRPDGGSFTARPVFPPIGMMSGSNVIEPRYDDNDTTLYALHWGIDEPTSFSSSFRHVMCAGGSYRFGDSLLVQAGVYHYSYISVNGYDSLVTLTLDTTDHFQDSSSISICAGSSFIFGRDTLTQSGTYADTLTALGGCDSIVSLILTVNNTNRVKYTQYICSGSSYLFGYNYLTQSGTYRDTLAAIGGCDSITTLTLFIDTLPPQPTIAQSADTLTGISSVAVHYQWQVNGLNILYDTTESTVYTYNGNYTLMITDSNGCSNTSNPLSITNTGIKDIEALSTIAIYPNPNKGLFTIEAAGMKGRQYYICNMLGQRALEGVITSLYQPINGNVLAPGVYSLHIADTDIQEKFAVVK